MKSPTLRLSLCVLVQCGAICGAAYWQNETHPFNPIGVLLAWPAVWLARFGMSHTWPVALVILLAMPAASVFVFRKRRPFIAATITALLTLAFCGAGTWRAGRATNTRPPANPYPAASPEAAKYLEGYGLGFGNAVTGSMATYCFRPEEETRGYYQGQDDGMRIWNRAFGLREDGARGLIRRSAAVDGVRTELLSK